MAEWWEYDELESGFPYDWSPASRNDHPEDKIDFHLDLGAGTVPKARLSIDRFQPADIVMDLNTLQVFDAKGTLGERENLNGLPFPDNSIESIISHHCLEHIGDGFIRLMDECYRVLKPNGKFRIIVPLFPSFNAVDDPDHVRYFTVNTFDSFVHEAGDDTPFWTESFSTPYTKCRFHLAHREYTPAEKVYADRVPVTLDDLFKQGREIRVTLQKLER